MARFLYKLSRLSRFIYKNKKVHIPLIAGALFLFFSWLTLATITCPLPTEQKPLIFYSNQTQQDLKTLYCTALKRCQKSLHLQVYSITDSKIIHLLKQKEDEGIFTTIQYDPTASSHLEKTLKTASPIKSRGLMHRKIVTLDDHTTFLGSANLTTSSLQMHDNLVLGLYHPPLTQFLKQPSGDYYSFYIQDQPAELWLLPSLNALHHLIQLIDNAHHQILIAMFTFTHPQIVTSLIEAVKRGVDVQIALDYHTGHGASLHALSTLEAAGIPITLSRGLQLLHHKWAIVDQNTLITGSANWTQAAFKKNEDCFLIIHSLTKDQKQFLKTLWKTIKMETV